METISFEYCGEGDVATTARLAVWTFANVTNAGEVRAALLSGELDCAVMNARAVAGMACLKLAAYRAIVARARGALVTRAVHSELVISMSPNRHISEAFRRFGGDEKSDALVLCKFDSTDEDTEKITNAVRGDCVAFDARPAVDEASLRKWYKVHENELELGSLEDAVLSRIAIRDVI